jgi:GTP-binding protein YchF
MLRTALIGFPSVGKTSLFQLMTSHADAHRGAHARVEAAVGIARVPDARLDRLAEMFKPRKPVAATVEVADLGGMGRPAAEALLDVVPFRAADALVHVVRAFRDASVPHAPGSLDPARDAQAMEDELILADLGVAEKRLERIERDLRKARTPLLDRERAVLVRCRASLEQGTALRALELDEENRKLLRGFQFLSAKPLLVVLNVDEADVSLLSQAPAAAAAAGLDAFLSRAATRAVPVCAKIELEISQLDSADGAAFLADLGLSEPGVARVIRAVYTLLGYMSFFTIGDHECRAWSIPRGSTALAAAAEVHTDMARGFIRAEVVTYDTLMARGSMAACREHGEVRLEGKDHVVLDGDIIHFRFAT